MEDNFAVAFKYALDQGIVKFGMKDFQGWQDDCDCASCRSQRIIFDYLWPAENPPNNANGADGPSGGFALGGRWAEG